MDQSYDLLVVGGGINGAAIARDAAGRGWRVLLVEQGDLASATSSASTKLIHGGLRYLEMYDFGLVRESLQERETMLRAAPHLIRPMTFVLPHVAGLRPWWLIRAGLLLYDRLGGRSSLPRSRGLRLGNSPYRGLRDDIRRGFSYSDAWVDDARLVVLNALDAMGRGAEIAPRTALVSARRDGDRWRAVLGDGRTVAARALVNATGPWVAETLGALGFQARSRVRLDKGSHIVVPRLYEGDHAFLLQQPDGRIVFAIPYEERFTLVGTTDVPWQGPPRPAAIAEEETLYLCAAANRFLRTQISPADVVWSYAGIRALHDDGAASAKEVTRDYRLELDSDSPPLLSVFGGKITTARRLAEEAAGLIAPAAHLPGDAWTRGAALPGGDIGGDFAGFLADVRRRWPFLGEARAGRMARAYGSRLSLVLGDAGSAADLGEDFGAGLTAREVEYLVAHEWAGSAEDILWRRTKLGLHMTEAQRAELRRRWPRV